MKPFTQRMLLLLIGIIAIFAFLSITDLDDVLFKFGHSVQLSVEKQAVINKLNVSAQHQFLVGQSIAQSKHNRSVNDQLYEINKLYSNTGKYLAMVESDYYIQDGTKAEWQQANPAIISYAKDGGIVMMSMSMRNYMTNGTLRDRNINVAAMSVNGTKENAGLRAELDDVALGIKQLDDENIIVLLRPWHEMQGGWFWWGNREFKDYTALWKFTYQYLTIDKQLNNILWVWCPNTGSTTRNGQDAYKGYYPGNEYVDIVALDWYESRSPTLPEGTRPQLWGYNELLQFKKPMGLAEYSPYAANSPKPTQYSAIEFEQRILTDYPEIDFVVHYQWTYGLLSMSNVTEYLNSPNVITREELK